MLKKTYDQFSKQLKNLKNLSEKKTKQKIEIQNPYHHNFKYNYGAQKNRDAEKIFFDVFDLARVFGAAFFVIKIGMKMPSYCLFYRTKYENNPDFMLCDQAQFEKFANQ